MLRQDSIKRYDKNIESIKDETINFEIDIEETNYVIKHYELEIGEIQRNIETLEQEISNQSNILEIAEKYLQFIEQHPIKYRVYCHTGLIPSIFHESLMKYNLQRKNHIEISSCISEVNAKINELEGQQKETTIQRSKKEQEMGKAKENRSGALNAIALLKNEISELSELRKKETEELQYLNDALSSLQNIEVDQYFKNNILKNKMVKQVQNYEKMQNLIEKQNDLDDKVRDTKLELTAKENDINNLIKEINKLKNDKEIDEKIKNAEIEILKKHHIIATTNMQASKLFEMVNFDLTIMDEAGAIDLPGGLIPILSAERLVLLGDHKQLAPITGSRGKIDAFFSDIGTENKKRLKSSIFELLFDKVKNNTSCIIKLRKQYRMRGEISDFISRYYEGNLEYKDDFDFKLKGIQNEILGSKQPFVCFKRDFFSKKLRDGWKSENEMLLIKNIVESFKKACGDKILTKIGIISAYKEQAKLIRKEMKSSGLTIDCSTVHKFQGQEKRIIIFSTAMQSSQFLGGKDGWRLLNVAVSRAKEKIILIGSDKLFREIPDYADLQRYILKGNGKISPSDEETIFDPKVKCKKCGNRMSPAFELCPECNDIKAIDEAKRTEPNIECDDTINKVRSTHEKIIDDWLYHHGIEHEYEKELPFESWCDWYIKSADKYIEYFGFDSYTNNTRRIKTKIRKYKKNNLKLIDLYPEDLKNIDKILSERLGQFNGLK